MSLIHQLIAGKSAPAKKARPSLAAVAKAVADAEAKPKAGRKRAAVETLQGEQMVTMRMPRTLLASLDEWAARQKPPVTRSTAIRHLIEAAVCAENPRP